MNLPYLNAGHVRVRYSRPLIDLARELALLRRGGCFFSGEGRELCIFDGYMYMAGTASSRWRRGPAWLYICRKHELQMVRRLMLPERSSERSATILHVMERPAARIKFDSEETRTSRVETIPSTERYSCSCSLRKTNAQIQYTYTSWRRVAVFSERHTSVEHPSSCERSIQEFRVGHRHIRAHSSTVKVVPSRKS